MNSRGSYTVHDMEKHGFTNPGFVMDHSSQKSHEVKKSSPTKDDKEKDENYTERGHWGGSAEFVLSCLGYAVGLGNVWRFPYLVYRNGGGAFLIPYILMLLLVGLPCFFMEMIVGQYSACGPIHLWSIAPIFRGLGYGMLTINFLGSINYNVIISWSFYYLFASWQSVLPWSDCKHDYNTPYCYTIFEAEDCEKNYNATQGLFNSSDSFNSTGTSWWFNQTCFNSSYCSTNEQVGCNKTYVEATRVSASQEYFKLSFLKTTASLDESGTLQWAQVLTLLLAWIVVWLCMIKGIKTAGKVVYFTAIFPYIIIFILLIRGALLEGSLDGVIYYLRPRWERLANARVWVDAAGQVFFSLSVGGGGLMTFASYNKFNNNIYRDSLIVIFLDAVTSIIAGFPIFSILGHLALKLGKTVENVVSSGPGLAFIAYPEVVTYLPASQFWATLFFLMLITLGLDSQMAAIEAIMTAITDTWIWLRKWKPLVSGGICIVMFFLAFPMCLQSSEYWVNIMNSYPGSFSLIIVVAIELTVFGWIYGTRRLMRDLEEMTGVKLWWHWWVLMKIIAPILVIAILIFSFVDFKPLKYPNKEDYPVWSQVIGMLMALLSIVFIPFIACLVVYKSYSEPEYDGLSFGKRLWALFNPSSKWMPGPEKAKLEAEQARMEANKADENSISF